MKTHRVMRIANTKLALCGARGAQKFTSEWDEVDCKNCLVSSLRK